MLGAAGALTPFLRKLTMPRIAAACATRKSQLGWRIRRPYAVINARGCRWAAAGPRADGGRRTALFDSGSASRPAAEGLAPLAAWPVTVVAPCGDPVPLDLAPSFAGPRP